MNKFLSIVFLTVIFFFGMQATNSEAASGFVSVNDYYVFTDRDGTNYYIYYIAYPGAGGARGRTGIQVNLKGVKNGEKLPGDLIYYFESDGSYMASSAKGRQHGLISENAIAKKVYDAIKNKSELTKNATSLLQNKKYSEAMRAYKDLLQKYPDDSEVSAAAYYGIGGCYYFGEKNYSAAIENYERSISFDSTNPDIYKYLGLSYAGINNAGKAIDNFDKAISLNPKDHQSYYFAALVYVNLLKDYNKGAEYCEKATKLYPRQFDYFYILGCCYSYINQDEKALDAFKFALKLKPNSKEAKAAIDAYKSRKN